jgi:oxygen-dependent protoporphyrinogen oxidase
MAGGAANPQILNRDDTTILETILDELRPHLGLRGTPSMVKLFRYGKAIAQYEPGHLALLLEVDQIARSHPGLFLTGSSYRGISVNACIKEAEQVAGEVLGKVSGCS